MMGAENTKTNSKVVGVPFQKGQSGNPGGRPKRDPAEVAKWMEAAKGNLKVLIDIRDNGEKDSDRIKAIEIIEDRSYGKPLQQVEADVNANVNAVISIGVPDFAKDEN